VAHPRHVHIRQRYNYRCGYCGVSEGDTGSELTVDHYRPRSANSSDDEDNLVYACIKCNQFKGGFFPDTDDLQHGRRVLHPLRDEISAHIREDTLRGYLEPLTEIGRFHIALLQLNRPALVAHRIRQRLAILLAEKQRLLELENEQLRATIAAQETHIAHLRRLLGLPPPA
jgi:HNH endonuclease